jgi:hypothetical protein
MVDLYVVLNQQKKSLKHSKTLGPEEKDQTALVKRPRVSAKVCARPRGSREDSTESQWFCGGKNAINKKGSRDKVSQPLDLYGRDGVIRTLDP